MKLGRLTIHPEAAMWHSGLLPEKPGGWNIMDGVDRSVTPTASEPASPPNGTAQEEEGLQESILTTLGIPNGVVANTVSYGSADSTADAAESKAKANGSATIEANPASDEGWTWQMIEAENAKGLKFAKLQHALDGLTETFSGSRELAIGYYKDIC
jgi:hypothetical protein